MTGKSMFVWSCTVLIAGTLFAQRAAEDGNNDKSPSTQPVNTSAAPQYLSPVIENYGKVVQFPDAPHQPRHGSKILVDVTKGGDAAELNPAIEKVARFVNIYAGAGKTPASAEIAVVLHGDATLTILKHEIYAERFETNDNPNIDCLRELHEAGVQIVVCGQSLTSKGGKPEQVVKYAETAVSGLTALVNLQADGYSYVPLK